MTQHEARRALPHHPRCARHGAPLTRCCFTCIHVLAGAAITRYRPDRFGPGRYDPGEALCRLCADRSPGLATRRMVCSRCLMAMRVQQLVQ